MPETHLYRAFISYSHKDSKWARWLLSALENYRVPQDIAPPADGILPKQLGKFFRDRDDASAATNLAEEIRNALTAAENLIVIASPHSARSAYVNQEIIDFAAINDKRAEPGRILTLVVDGEPAISKGQEPAERECFPFALRGGLTLSNGSTMEPLAADARKTGDGKTRALAKLVSGLLGIRYDTLVRRDLQRQRQRRLWFAAAGMALIVSAGLAGFRIETDRREKQELQRQQEQAAREEAVMRAVNTAERAKGFLERGNTRMALNLARRSRGIALSLPFIPQVYDVLFTAHVQRARPVTVDIGTAVGPMRKSFHYPISNGEYLSADGMWGGKIWSPSTGITYARSDLDSGTLEPAMALDNSMVLLKGNDLAHLHRFWITDRSWDKVGYSDLSFGDYNPSAIFAPNGNELVGCAAKGVFGATLPPKGSNGAQATLTWEMPLDNAGCLSLAALGPDTMLVGTDKGEVLEVETATRRIRLRHALQGSDWPYFITPAGSSFKVGGTRFDYIFQKGQADAVLVANSSSGIRLSQDGLYAFYPDPGGPTGGQYLILDMAAGSRTKLDCTCRPEGFDGDNNLITNELDGVKLRSVRDGSLLRPLFNFTKPVDELLYLAQDKLVAGLRDLDPATVISTKDQPLRPLLSGARNGRALLSSAQFLDDDHVAAVWNKVELVGLEKVKTEGRRQNYSLEVYNTKSGVASLPSYVFGPVKAHIEVQAAGHGLLMLTLSEDALSWPRRALIVEPLRNTVVFDGPVLSPPVIDSTRATAILETAEGFTLVSLKDRKRASFEIGKAMPHRQRFWFLDGQHLHSGDEKALRGMDFSSVPPKALPAIDLGGHGNFMCPDPASRSVFLVNARDKQALYQQWSLDGGGLLHEQQLPATRDDAFQVIADAAMWIDREQYFETVHCANGAFLIRDLVGKALKWNVAAKTISVIDDVQSSNAISPPDEAPAPEPAAEVLAAADFSFTDKTADLRDSKGALLVRLEADGARFTTGTYLRRRGIVAMGLENGELRAWNVRHPVAPIIQLKMHESEIKALDSPPSETQLMTADLGGTVYVLPLPDMDDLERMVADSLP